MSQKRRAWTVTLAVFFASVAATTNQFKVPPVMEALMADLDLGMVAGGWTMSIFSVTGVVLAIPAALVLRRVGLKWTGVAAMGCTVAGAVMGAMANSATAMLAGRLVEGTGAGLMAIAAPAAISAWFPPRERGIPMGIWSTWAPLGNVIMFNLAHPLTVSFGWRGVWWFGAFFAALALVVWALLVSEPAWAGLEDSTVPAGFGRVLLNADSWLLALGFGALAFSLLSYNTWAPAYLSDALGMEPARASFMASLLFLAGIPGNLSAGWMLSRTGRPYRLLAVAFLATGILFAWSFRLGSVAIVAPYMVALGFLSNIIPTTEFTLAPETMPLPSLAGLALAILGIGSGTGIIMGPPLLGAVINGRGWAAGSWLLVLAMAVGLVSAVAGGRRSRVRYT